jgi:hypothetical protein
MAIPKSFEEMMNYFFVNLWWQGAMKTRKEHARVILESVLDDRGNQGVTTMDLLYRCQDVARLLDLDQTESEWIDLELMGYPLQHIGSSKESLPHGQRVPQYRMPMLPATGSTPMPSVIPFHVQYFNAPTAFPFCIAHPCGFLESSKSPVELSYSTTIPKPKDRYDLGNTPDNISVTFSAKLSVDRMRGIAQAIRARVSSFATAHYTALHFETPLQSIFDATRNLLADRLNRLHPPTLDLITETVSKQEGCSDPVEWHDVLGKVRTILRSFTTKLLRDSMIPQGKTRPADAYTNKKASMILEWAKPRMDASVKGESKYILKTFEVLKAQKTMLIKMINKHGHADFFPEVTKGEVDRILLMTVVWMSDLIAILDRAGYDWDVIETPLKP